MKIQKAVKLACLAIDAEIQRLAVNANLFEHYGMEAGKAAHEKRQALQEARAVLVGLASQPRQMDLFER